MGPGGKEGQGVRAEVTASRRTPTWVGQAGRLQQNVVELAALSHEILNGLDPNIPATDRPNEVKGQMEPTEHGILTWRSSTDSRSSVPTIPQTVLLPDRQTATSRQHCLKRKRKFNYTFSVNDNISMKARLWRKHGSRSISDIMIRCNSCGDTCGSIMMHLHDSPSALCFAKGGSL